MQFLPDDLFSVVAVEWSWTDETWNVDVLTFKMMNHFRKMSKYNSS